MDPGRLSLPSFSSFSPCQLFACLLLSRLISLDSLGFLLGPYAAPTGRRPNKSLGNLTRCCPFTHGHSGVFRLLVVFILQFLKKGTPSPVPYIWLYGEGLNFFIKKFRGVSKLIARYILTGFHWPRWIKQLNSREQTIYVKQ